MVQHVHRRSFYEYSLVRVVWHKTSPMSRGRLVRVDECREQLIISCGKTHLGRGYGKGLFIRVGN